jgi:hypothetical protein
MKNSEFKTGLSGWVVLAVVVLAVGSGWAQTSPEDYLPRARVQYPNLGSQGYKIVPPTFTVGVMGTDPDSDTAMPVKFRMFFIEAQYGTDPYGNPLYIRTKSDYENYGRDLIPWDHPYWSEWIPYSPDSADRMVTFPNLQDEAYFLFAVQVMDVNGAVSTGLDYQIEVMHLKTQAGVFAPYVGLHEPFLPDLSSTVAQHEIAAGQPLNFFWEASAAAYNGTIVSCRHGWDIIDTDDPNDPGWAVPAGLEPENFVDQERTFQDGIHTFDLVVVDNVGQQRHMQRVLTVVPFVDPSYQLPLALIDQVVDKNVQTWPDAQGVPRDQDSYRDGYWSFIAGGSGGVAGFNSDRDWFDDVESVRYSDVVKYRAVLCYARFNNVGQTMFAQFRPQNDLDQYVWLDPYQQRGGNLFLVGDRSMESFLEAKDNYMIPMIFDTRETTFILDGQTYIVGFGTTEAPDGTLIDRGPRMYPYATAGIAALDWTSPQIKNIYARWYTAKYDRVVDCVGLKGLVLDSAFRSSHGVAVGAVADTILTDGVIDWQDPYYILDGTLGLDNGTFRFRDDEFYDANISSRPTAWNPQECVEGPNGKCVEPMWRGISRYDWMREYYRGQGEDWPASQYTPFEVEYACGPMALSGYDNGYPATARTNDRVYGFMSYKTIEDKPSNKADVYWGFDPYRFDNVETKKAVRWVLDYFGLNVNP